MLNKNTISVVCPVFNSEEYIQKTIKSVLNQTLQVEELILIDDGSSDKTINIINDIIDQYNGPTDIILIKSSHQGPGVARNIGIKKAKSEWISFLDSDDHWLNNKIEVVKNHINNGPLINILCHSEKFVRIDKTEINLDYHKHYDPNANFSKLLYKVNLFSPSATTCKKSLILNYGLFDPNLPSCQDYDLWLKLSPYMNPFFIKDVLGIYFEREGNISNSKMFVRFKNRISVQWRYRSYVGFLQFLYSCSKTVLVFVFNFFKKFLKNEIF